MNLVANIQEKRGIVEISTDCCEHLKVRKKHFAQLPLEEGDEVDLQQYENRMASIQFQDAYEAALTSLDYSARTAKEIEKSLLQKGYVPQAAAATVQRLIENRLIDDRQLAERIAQNNAAKPVGLYTLKRKMRAKGISEEDASEALELFDDEQQGTAARAAAEKLYRKYRNLPAREARNKLSQALARRGFPWDAVHGAVEAVTGDADDSDDFSL